MSILWERSPRSAQEVIELLQHNKQWNPRTIRTFLNRLVRKGALAYRVEGNRYLYRPAVSRERCVHEESRSFLTRVFANSTGHMLLQLVQEAQLTPDEITALRKALQEKKGER